MAILPVVTLANRVRTLVTDSTIAKQTTFHGKEQQTCHAERFCRSGIERAQETCLFFFFLFLEPQLGRFKWLGVTCMPKHWSYIEESLLTCWVLGLKWLKGLGQLKLLTRAPTFGFSLWLGISRAWVPSGNNLWESVQRAVILENQKMWQSFLTWLQISQFHFY